MATLKPEVKEFLTNAKIWTLSTNGEDGPNGIPCLFHTVTDDDKLLFACVFMEITPANLAKDGRVCVSAYDVPAEGMPSGYLVKGDAVYEKEGKYADMAFQMTAPLRERGITPKGGAIVIDPKKCVYAGPGPMNGKEVE